VLPSPDALYGAASYPTVDHCVPLGWLALAATYEVLLVVDDVDEAMVPTSRAVQARHPKLQGCARPVRVLSHGPMPCHRHTPRPDQS
jgi:hypothetical protein